MTAYTEVSSNRITNCPHWFCFR